MNADNKKYLSLFFKVFFQSALILVILVNLVSWADPQGYKTAMLYSVGVGFLFGVVATGVYWLIDRKQS